MIQELFHRYNGVPGYRQMRIYLEREGIFLSYPTVHKYMNKELGLIAIVRSKRKNFHSSGEHKVFKNLLKGYFTAPRANMKWATDFTYLYLKDDRIRYSCTIIDLYDRSVVSSLTGSRMTGELAKETLSRALKGRCGVKNLILHSDQGSPYTSRVFCEYCERAGIIQSMSRAGCPYNNAPMERYFNTLKTEHIYLHEYEDEDSLYRAVEEFAYVHYNHVRPHTYNNQKTPKRHRLKHEKKLAAGVTKILDQYTMYGSLDVEQSSKGVYNFNEENMLNNCCDNVASIWVTTRYSFCHLYQ